MTKKYMGAPGGTRNWFEAGMTAPKPAYLTAEVSHPRSLEARVLERLANSLNRTRRISGKNSPLLKVVLDQRSTGTEHSCMISMLPMKKVYFPPGLIYCQSVTITDTVNRNPTGELQASAADLVAQREQYHHCDR